MTTAATTATAQGTTTPVAASATAAETEAATTTTATQSTTASDAQTKPTEAAKNASAQEAKGSGEGESLIDLSKVEEKTETKTNVETKAAEVTDFELKLPDGFKVNEEVMGGFKALAKEQKFTPELAQKLFDFSVAQQKAQEAEWVAKYKARDKAWVEEVKADKEFGGAKFAESRDFARKGALAIGGQELLDALGEHRISNDPRIFRALVRAGQRISEDSTAGTHGQGKGGTPTMSQRLASIYDSPDMQKARK